MTLQEYTELDAVALAELIRRGDVGEAEVADTARRAIESVEGDVNALAFPLFDEPLAHAADGPLAGVPFLIKDVGPVAEGVPFSLGSRLFDGTVAPRDNLIMGRFRTAGLAALGTTNVPELAISFATESALHGITRNPWDPERGTGGSSGGSAALVAARAVPLAHGNDGAGSIRIPACCCGLVGLKPSRGRTPNGPYVSEAIYGLGYEFGLTRSVRDAAVLLDAVQGPASGEKYAAPTPSGLYAAEVGEDPGPLRVGLATAAWSGVAVDPECAAAAEEVARVLADMGHDVTTDAPAIDAGDVLDVYDRITVLAFARLLAIAPTTPSHENLAAVSLSIWEDAPRVTALDIAAAFDAFNRVQRAAAAFFTGHDVLITPTLAQIAPPHGTLRYDDPAHTPRTWAASILEIGPFTAPFNIGGQPAISLPLAQSAEGVPIGVQLVAPYGREDVLLRLASRLEQALPWADRRPRVHARG